MTPGPGWSVMDVVIVTKDTYLFHIFTLKFIIGTKSLLINVEKIICRTALSI